MKTKKNLPSKWFENEKTPEDKEKLKLTLEGSSFVFQKLASIIDELQKSLEKTELTEADFDCPNWAQRQAFRNGQRAGYSQIQTLLGDQLGHDN